MKGDKIVIVYDSGSNLLDNSLNILSYNIQKKVIFELGNCMKLLSNQINCRILFTYILISITSISLKITNFQFVPSTLHLICSLLIQLRPQCGMAHLQHATRLPVFVQMHGDSLSVCVYYHMSNHSMRYKIYSILISVLVFLTIVV